MNSKFQFWMAFVFWVIAIAAIVTAVQGCATVIVQIGESNSTEDNTEAKRSIETNKAATPKRL